MTIKRFSERKSPVVSTPTQPLFALDGHANFFAQAALNPQLQASELPLTTPDCIRLHTKTSRTTNKA